jgi:asparagine synthase (glutamine-hydrolysing)
MVGNTNPWLDSALADHRSSTLNRVLRYELTQQLRSQVTRLDKLTMAHSVEARCPFLDPMLVDFVANLPAHMRVHGRREKVLLKAAMSDRLPAAIVARRKFGMSNPVTTLFRGGFREICRDAFHAQREVLGAYFSLDAVSNLFNQIGRYPGWLRIPEQQLFHIYLFLQWHALFIEGRVPGLTGAEVPRSTARRSEQPLAA